MRLGGWQRIGIVASAAWFIIGVLLANESALKNAANLTELHTAVCVDKNKDRLGEYAPYEQIWAPCNNEQAQVFAHFAEGHWNEALFVGLAPIPPAWLIGWGILALTRWVRRGFLVR